jgi:hypothetical protein
LNEVQQDHFASRRATEFASVRSTEHTATRGEHATLDLVRNHVFFGESGDAFMHQRLLNWMPFKKAQDYGDSEDMRETAFAASSQGT